MSKLEKILVAYDGSVHSKAALNWAIDLCHLSGAEIVVVKVFEGSELYVVADNSSAVFLAELEEIRRRDQLLMDEVFAVCQERGVKVTGEILKGNVALEIISYAKQNGIDLIVAGTKGHGALEELLMGSVTRKLVSLSQVPVLVVKG